MCPVGLRVYDDSRDRDFSDWVLRSRPEVDEDADVATAADPDLRWYRDTYRELGPLSGPELREHIERTRRNVLTEALRIFQDDVEKHHGRRLAVSVKEAPRQTLNREPGFFLLDSDLRSLSLPAAIVEVGEILQDEMVDVGMEVWPACDQHQVGGHLRVAGDHAAWWCEYGDHLLWEIRIDS
jgi:hypothetical protein